MIKFFSLPSYSKVSKFLNLSSKTSKSKSFMSLMINTSFCLWELSRANPNPNTQVTKCASWTLLVCWWNILHKIYSGLSGVTAKKICYEQGLGWRIHTWIDKWMQKLPCNPVEKIGKKLQIPGKNFSYTRQSWPFRYPLGFKKKI